MAKPYSDDLRERAVAAIESGHTREEVAELYNLALAGDLGQAPETPMDAWR
jgi:transposase